MAYIFAGGEWRLKNGAGEKSLREFVNGRTHPFYLYDLDEARARARAFHKTGARIHYAMKANSNPHLLRTFVSEGLGADVVSLGEMKKALKCGVPAERIIFSGVGKGREELEAAIAANILQINVESFEELQALEAICQERRQGMDVALRLNIHITAPTHKNIQTATPESKFGLDQRQLPEVLGWLKQNRLVRLASLTVHIGSQIVDTSVFERMAKAIGTIYNEVKSQGFPLRRLDMGGGFGIDYKTEGADDMSRVESYLKTILSAHGTDAEIILEPGRILVARIGVLIARVIYVKKTADREFVILNAGMNALMRPALYQSYHRIEPLRASEGTATYTVVGPLCESTDTFAEAREMKKMKSGDWVGIFDAGAYGAVMANTYNEMPLPEQISVLDGVTEIS